MGHKNGNIGNMCSVLGNIDIFLNLLDMVGNFSLALTTLEPPSHLQQT